MPRATARRSGREPKSGSRFPSQILADNVRIWRDLRRMSQADLAEHMTRLGHPWSDSIVGFVERGQRNVTVDEFVGLTLALGVHQPGALLDPLGPLVALHALGRDAHGCASPAQGYCSVGISSTVAYPCTN